MNSYVINNSIKDKLEGRGLTFLFVSKNEKYLYGYYSLFATSVIYSDDKTDEFVGIPSIELKLFAINQELSGKASGVGDYNYSDILLMYIITTISEHKAKHMGINAIVLRSTEEAVNFYLKNKFTHFEHLWQLPYDHFSRKCIPLIYALPSKNI